MKQITLMNVRAAALVIGPKERWSLAGVPHGGCRKFTDRFGMDAVKFVNSDQGMSLRLRGANARVVDGGVVRTGDSATVESRSGESL